MDTKNINDDSVLNIILTDFQRTNNIKSLDRIVIKAEGTDILNTELFTNTALNSKILFLNKAFIFFNFEGATISIFYKTSINGANRIIKSITASNADDVVDDFPVLFYNMSTSPGITNPTLTMLLFVGYRIVLE
jgi:hypothetical protein